MLLVTEHRQLPGFTETGDANPQQTEASSWALLFIQEMLRHLLYGGAIAHRGSQCNRAGKGCEVSEAKLHGDRFAFGPRMTEPLDNTLAELGYFGGHHLRIAEVLNKGGLRAYGLSHLVCRDAPVVLAPAHG